MPEIVRLHEGTAEIDWSRLLKSEVADLTEDERFVAVSILDAGTKAFDQRLSDLKAQVRKDVGEGLAPGTSRTAEHGGVTIQVTQKKTSVKVNEVALLAVLSRKGLDPETLCFQKVLALDTARLEQAVAGGVFTDDDVRSFSTETQQTPSVTVKTYAMGITAKKLLGSDK